MLKLLNVRFVFSLRTSHTDQGGKHPIILRVTYLGQRRDIFTGLYCQEKFWDRINKKVLKEEKHSGTLNSNLEMILHGAKNSFDELKFRGESFTVDELINKIRGKEKKPTLLIDYLKSGSSKILNRVGTDIVKATYNKYNRSILYMQDYLESEYKVKNYNLEKLNSNFFEEYFHFLRSSKGIGHNTACKYLSCIKSSLLPAIREGILKSDPFLGLKIKSKPVFRQFLSQEEINKIAALELGDPDLDRKRDIFLFACYTGLAYVDLYHLNQTHLIKETDGSWHIRKPRQKTGIESIIPLLPAAQNILKKYSHNNSIAGFSWYVSSNQKMNLGLKYIAKRAGLTKQLHMHLARHTFATEQLYQVSFFLTKILNDFL